uniref:Uncharacterized protein n=1 Tax=Sphaerodactylus townsendi TaxID=933632 RepID=A0ACB8FBN4_9SAUR
MASATGRRQSSPAAASSAFLKREEGPPRVLPAFSVFFGAVSSLRSSEDPAVWGKNAGGAAPFSAYYLSDTSNDRPSLEMPNVSLPKPSREAPLNGECFLLCLGSSVTTLKPQ